MRSGLKEQRRWREVEEMRIYDRVRHGFLMSSNCGRGNKENRTSGEFQTGAKRSLSPFELL